MTDEAEADATPDKAGVTSLTQARLCARHGQFSEARQLVSQAQALLSPLSSPADHADVLEAKAEVERLAGEPGQAAASMRAALQIYEDRRATALAGRARAALASLTEQPGREPT